MTAKPSPRDESHIWGRAAVETAPAQPRGYWTIDEAKCNFALYPPIDRGREYCGTIFELARNRSQITSLDLLAGIRELRALIKQSQARLDTLSALPAPQPQRQIKAWCAEYRKQCALAGELAALETELTWRRENKIVIRVGCMRSTMRKGSSAGTIPTDHAGPPPFDPFESQ